MYNLDIIDQGKRVLEIESETINRIRDNLDGNFVNAVQLLCDSKGRVFISGIGKSGLIGRKIAATMSSTGTPTVFVHPTESFHGDMGIISKDDVGILISYSGETDELIQTIPFLKRIGIKLIGITGNSNSTLAKNCETVLRVDIEQEACPMGMVPTASTTGILALGDALAVALLIKKGFTSEDFAKLHPGGSLGRRMLIRVKDIMHRVPNVPLVKENVSMNESIIEMTSKSLGVTGVIDSHGKLVGVITDGDLRRLMDKNCNFSKTTAGSVMTVNPKVIDGEELAVDALNKMEQYKITHLFVLSKDGTTVEGLIHIHNILGAKIL